VRFKIVTVVNITIVVFRDVIYLLCVLEEPAASIFTIEEAVGSMFLLSQVLVIVQKWPYIKCVSFETCVSFKMFHVMHLRK